MAFCKNCGQEIAEGATACANCGTPVETAAPVQETPVQEVAQPVQYAPPVNNTAEATMDDDVKNNKGISVLSYFGLLLLIPLFVKKTSEYCKFHVKQGANLFVIEVAYAIATQILLAIIGLIFRPTVHTLYWVTYTTPSPVYTIFNLIFSLVYILFLVVSIIGIVNAATGKKNDVPVFGKFKFMDSVMDKIYDSLNK